jgi:hypothetical protein
VRILLEKRLDDADEDRLTERVVYFDNGCVVRQVLNAKGNPTEKEILIRLVYADRKTINEILELLKPKYAKRFNMGG